MLPNAAQDALPQTPRSPTLPPQASISSDAKKRKPSDVDVRDSAYFKILLLVQKLRPLFIEALQTPDFRNCSAAYEIRKRMKLVMDLYKQLQTEGNVAGNDECRTAHKPLSNEKNLEKELSDELYEGRRHLEPLGAQQVQRKSSPEKEFPPCPFGSGENFDIGRSQGSYIIGGSLSGWNFITFAHRNPPVYYGVTKESYRRNHIGVRER